MADACCAPTERTTSSDTGGACPGCGRRGRPIALATVQSLVAISLRELAQTPYEFCATPDCAVVYYAAAVASHAPARGAITRDQLRERVLQKEPAPDVLVCYCFGYSLGAIQQGDKAERPPSWPISSQDEPGPVRLHAAQSAGQLLPGQCPAAHADRCVDDR